MIDVRMTNLEDMVYRALAESGRFMTSIEVAKALGIERISVSPRFAPLERKGLIERSTKPAMNSAGDIRTMQAWKALPRRTAA